MWMWMWRWRWSAGKVAVVDASTVYLNFQDLEWNGSFEG